MPRTLTGWFLGITGFLACPCHLVITLPLAAALLSGTALGGWITTHQGAIFVGASIYFVGALTAGATLLLAGKGVLASTAGQQREGLGLYVPSASVGADCCAPTTFAAASSSDTRDEGADTAPVGGSSGTAGAKITRRETEDAGTPASR